ncbi:MAG TPA: HEAT repeat domain-containing protein [Gemmatimonadales bacterium]|nr:HEAT repeat domain-containing protein [Gemmatimonadales bacterium]
MRDYLVAVLFISGLAPGLSAQTLAQRVAEVEEGTVRLSFAARPGVCGDWKNGVTIRHESDEWQADCGSQTVQVALRVRDHRVYSVRTYVGGRWLPDRWSTDLGTVPAPEAADYFIGLAERSGDGKVGGDPLLPSALADSVVIWPSLLRLARTPRLSRETRSQAIFWLSQAAGAAVGAALDSIVDDARGDREIREKAIFALSQRSNDEGVPALIRIARTNPDPELRKTALFWLGQSEDPRALDLFEEILK